MSTLAINTNNDIYFVSGRMALINGQNTDGEILQRIKIRLRFFKSEWFLNTDHGMPYFQEILGNKTIDLNIVESIFRIEILKIVGVKQIIESSIGYEGSQRKASYFFKALSINNNTITDNLIIV